MSIFRYLNLNKIFDPSRYPYDPQPGPVNRLVNWSRLTQISPANLVMLHAPPPSPLPPTGFSQGEGEIKQLVVTGDVLCTTLGLEESCWPPHVIGI